MADPFATRRRAREAAVQMLYACEVAGIGPEEAVAAHAEIVGQPVQLDTEEAREFAARLAIGTSRSIEEIDPIIAGAAENWRPSRMAVVDRAIIRLAVYQLLHVPDVPAVVAIDESVELARTYGGEESSRFVNGVLDAIRKRIVKSE
jgi:transcription antitermination protein NusB